MSTKIKRKLNYPKRFRERPESGQWLIECRIDLEITQKELAERLDVHVNSIANWERMGLPKIGTAREAVIRKIQELQTEREGS